MRITSLLAAVLVVAGLAYWFVLRHPGDGSETTAAMVATTPAETARRGAAPVSVEVVESRATASASRLILRGRTEALRSVQVAAETTGRVISEPLRRGSRVSAGQVLCELDPGVREAERAEAGAALAEARVEADAATQLKLKGFAAETTLRGAEARLQAAQARLDKVAWDIAQLEIRAPFDGILESDTAEFGAYLSPGMYCANVIDLSKVKVTAFVSEQEVEKLSVGQPAMARLINGLTAMGEIIFLSRMADPETRTFAVEVSIDNPDGRLRDGMTAELAIALPTEPGHLIPQSALTLNDAGTLGVRIDDDGIARFMPVRIIGEDRAAVRVAGLPETARVIVVGQEFVRDGRAVVGTLLDDAK